MTRIHSFVMLATLGLASSAIAQVASRPSITSNLASLEGKDNGAGVSVRDSLPALEQMDKAEKMQAVKEWAKSADLYQEVLNKYADRVIPADTKANAGDRVVQYISVTESVRQILCKWPEEGLTVYKGKYESVAANLLNGSNGYDPETLHQILSLYFPTDSAKLAAFRLMDMDFESGDYNSVAQIGRRLLAWHPNLTAERPIVLYRTALAEKLCGFNDQANARLADLEKLFPHAKGDVGGNDVILADMLKSTLAKQAEVIQSAGDDMWTTVGGDGSRGKISTSTVRPRARIYSIPLRKPDFKFISDETMRHTEQTQYDSEVKDGGNLGVMPVYDHDELFFQDNVCIYGRQLSTGAPLPGWLLSYPNRGTYQVDGQSFAMPAGRQLPVTIDDKHVIALMYSSVPMQGNNANLPPNIPPAVIARLQMQNIQFAGVFSIPLVSQLVCLDRQSGKELWRISARNLPDAQSNLRNLDLGGSPLIVGNNVYIGASSAAAGQGGEESYVLCYDITNGKLRWSDYVAGSMSSNVGFDMSGEPIFNFAHPSLAYASGRLFVSTSVGAIASLDAYTGAIKWLDIYRDKISNNLGGQQVFMGGGVRIRIGRGGGGWQMMGQANAGDTTPAPPPWASDSIITQDGRVFLLARDSDAVLIYDADSGTELKRIPLTEFPGEVRPTSLLAVSGERLFLSGADHVWSLSWAKYAPGFQPGYWRTGGNTTNMGRGFVTADAVYRSTKNFLQRIVAENGMIDDKDAQYPPSGWDASEEGPGNVVAGPNFVIVAGANQVAVYSDLEAARRRLDLEIAAHPTEALPELHYAEVMFAAFQLNDTLDRMNKALALLGGADHLPQGSARSRAYEDALRFADRLANIGQQETMTIQAFYMMASQAADNPAQQATVRLHRADFDIQSANDPATAIDLYQQILLDDGMRLVSVTDPDTHAGSQAGVVAQDKIAEILSHAGPGRTHYDQTYAAAAVEARGKALANEDPDTLVKIARGYPNSPAAEDSLQKAANIYESQSKPQLAADTLRQLLSHRPAKPSETLEMLARVYLRLGKIDLAVMGMGRAAAIAPTNKLTKPLEMPDGTRLDNITYAQARTKLADYRKMIVTDFPPDFQIPSRAQLDEHHNKAFSSPSSATDIPNAAALILPLEKFTRNDRLIAWNNAGLSIYPAGKNTAIFNVPSARDKTIGAAWTTKVLYFWSEGAVHAVDSESGKEIWSEALGSLPQADSTPPPPTSFGAKPQPPLNPDAEIVINNQNPVAQINQGPVPVHVPDQSGIEQITNVNPLTNNIVFATSTGRIFALKSSDGQLIWQTAVSGFLVDRMLSTDDFTVLRLAQGTRFDLLVLDSATGNMVGRKSFDSASPEFPLNIALSPEGGLVYTTKNRLCLIDLYEANLGDHGMEPTMTGLRQNEVLFEGMTYPGQLVVSGETVVALTTGCTRLAYYNLADLRSLRPQAEDDANDGLKVTQLNPIEKSLSLHVSKKYVFITGDHNFLSASLEHPDAVRPLSPNSDIPVHAQQFLIGDDFAILVSRPYLTDGPLGRQYHLSSFSRHLYKPEHESGGLVCTADLDSIDPNSTWQGFDGGIAYYSDGAIHMLLGLRSVYPVPSTAPATQNKP